jgi:hypothetical protein
MLLENSAEMRPEQHRGAQKENGHRRLLVRRTATE